MLERTETLQVDIFSSPASATSKILSPALKADSPALKVVCYLNVHKCTNTNSSKSSFIFLGKG